MAIYHIYIMLYIYIYIYIVCGPAAGIYIYIYIYPLFGLAGFLGFEHCAKHAHFSFQNSLFSRLFGRSCGVLLCEVRGACFYVVLRVVEIDSEPHPCVIVARNAVHMFIYIARGPRKCRVLLRKVSFLYFKGRLKTPSVRNCRTKRCSYVYIHCSRSAKVSSFIEKS